MFFASVPARKRFAPMLAGSLAAMLMLGGVASAQEDGVVARVNGAAITEEDLTVALRDFGSSLQGMSEAQKRETAIGLLIDVRLLAQAAEAEKLHETDEFARSMALQRDKVLMESYIAARGQEAVTDEAIQKVYDEQVKSAKPETEIRASHILVATEEEAKAVAERLSAGEDFAEVAKEVSTDTGSGAKGGDLGYFGEGRMIPVFYETAVATEVGQRSAPFKSEFGWHILTVTDKREKQAPALGDVRDQIVVYLERRAQQESILALREKAKIERTTPAPAPAPEGEAGAPAAEGESAPKN